MKVSNGPKGGHHKINLRSLLSRIFYSAVLGVILVQPTSARMTDAQCGAVRVKAGETNARWFGLTKEGEVMPLERGDGVNEKAINRIVYLHHRGDGNNQSTVVGVKITFHTIDNEMDKNWVRVKNNFKNAFSVTYEDYQAFHRGANDFDIRTNFHLSSGPFTPQIPFSTFDPLERRSQLRYADLLENDEETFRSYLFTLDGVKSIGSCVDFAPVLPDATKSLSIEIIDLFKDPETGVFYHGSLNLAVSE